MKVIALCAGADHASDGKLEIGDDAFRRRGYRRAQQIELRSFERGERLPQLRIVGAGGSKLLLRPLESASAATTEAFA